MECKELCELLLDDLLVSEDCAHVSSEGIHVLAHGDLVHLGLILECIKLGSEVLDLVLLGRRRTGHIRLCGSGEEGGVGWGAGGMGGGWLANLTRDLLTTKQSLVCCQLFLIRRFMTQVINRLGSGNAWLILLNDNGLIGLDPSLIIF